MWPPQLNLKLCFLNAENLFLLLDRPLSPELIKVEETQWQRFSTSVYENKPLAKLREMTRALLDINADVVMLCEVGGFESLNNYNELFLQGAYSPILIEGNSDRNIDVGFLVRKGSPFYFDLLSNKNRLINYLYPHERESAAQMPLPGMTGRIQSHKFSRDAVELRLFQRDKDKPFLLILLTHLKSRLDPERIDPGGFERRQAELKTLLEIYRELEGKFPGVPIAVAGDFNGNASRRETDEEFKIIYETTGLRDVLEIAQVPPEKRATFYNVRAPGKTDGRQIDFCFLSPDLTPHLKPGSAAVYRYRDEFGFEIGIPQTMDEKLVLPSDHYPLVFELENLQSW